MANDNNIPGSAAALFAGSGVRYVPGLGYVGPSAPNGIGALGDDASVMMISGLGAENDTRNYTVDEKTGAVTKVTGAGFKLSVALQQPVTIGSVTLPLWAWLLLATGVIGTAGYFLLFHKKK